MDIINTLHSNNIDYLNALRHAQPLPQIQHVPEIKVPAKQNGAKLNHWFAIGICVLIVGGFVYIRNKYFVVKDETPPNQS